MAKEKPKSIRVRVRARKTLDQLAPHETYPLHEAGETYHPARKVVNSKGQIVVQPADEFEVTQERAEALGDHIEVIATPAQPAS